MNGRTARRRRWIAAAAAPVAAGLLPAAAAGAADQTFISLRGTFDAAGAAQDFPLLFYAPASNVTMRTWHYSGGTNAAGQTIPGGSFDPQLRLYNSTGTEVASNDDILTVPFPLLDSRIIYTDVTDANYRLRLSGHSTGTNTGPWAVDAVSNGNWLAFNQDPGGFQANGTNSRITDITMGGSGTSWASLFARTSLTVGDTASAGTLTFLEHSGMRVDAGTVTATVVVVDGELEGEGNGAQVNIGLGRLVLRDSADAQAELVVGKSSYRRGSLYMGTTGSLSVAGKIVVGKGISTDGSFVLQSGKASAEYLELGTGIGSVGQLYVYGGELSATSGFSAGLFGRGEALQEGGEVESYSVKLGNSNWGGTGTYELRGGKLSAYISLVVDTAASRFVQRGGDLLTRDVTNRGTIELLGGTHAGDSLDNRSGAVVGARGVLGFPSVKNQGTLQSKGGDLVIPFDCTLTNGTSGTLVNAVGTSVFVEGVAHNGGNLVVNAGGAIAFDPATNPDLDNPGTIRLAGGTLQARKLYNDGTLSGYGQYVGDLDSYVKIDLNGPTVFDGGTLTNRAGATLKVRNAALIVMGKTVNLGSVQISAEGRVVFDGGVSASALPAALPGAPAGGPAGAAPLPAGSVGGDITLGPGCELVAPFLDQNSLTLAGDAAAPAVARLRARADGGRTSLLNRLDIPVSGTGALGVLDLADSALAVEPPAGPASPLSELRDRILRGRAGGTWGGNGITSSAAAADPAEFGLGYALASEVLGPGGGTFVGLPVSGQAVLIRYTLLGDTNLDGAVGFADLLKVAQNYDQAGKLWSDGDVDYDGAVGFGDLLLVAQKYDRALALPAGVPGAPADFQADWAAALELAGAPNSVPEPAGAALLGLLGAAWAMNRRHRATSRGH